MFRRIISGIAIAALLAASLPAVFAEEIIQIAQQDGAILLDESMGDILPVEDDVPEIEFEMPETTDAPAALEALPELMPENIAEPSVEIVPVPEEAECPESAVPLPEFLSGSGEYNYIISADESGRQYAVLTGYMGSDAEVVIPEEIDGYPIAAIGDNAFQNCAVLVRVSIGSGVKRIGSHAFYNCQALANVEFPEGLECIGEYAFCGCTSIENLYLPAHVEEFGKDAFAGCKNAAIWVYENTASHSYCRDCAAAQGFEYKIIGSEPVLAWKGNVQPIHFEKDGGAITLEIASNQAWNVCAPEWVQLSAAAGSGDGSLTITVPEYNGTSLQGSIVVSAPGCADIELPISRSSGCGHASGLYVYEEVEEEAYLSNGKDSHTYSYTLVSRVLSCWECEETLQIVEVGEKISEIEEHRWHNYDTGANNKLVCEDCGAKRTVSYPCKHKSLFMREDGNLECGRCGKKVLLNAKGKCSHKDFTVFEAGIPAIGYSRIDKNIHLRSESIHIYDDSLGAYRDAVCNICGEWLVTLNGKIHSIGVTDCTAVDFSEKTFMEFHDFHDGACVCGYVIPKIEFSGYENGDMVEINTVQTLAWSCSAFNDFAVHAKLLDGEPIPESDNEAGMELSLLREGNAVSFTVPDATGKYIKVHVQGIEKDGSLSRSESQLYLKVVDKNQITFSGKDRLAVGNSVTLKAYNLQGKAIAANKLKWTTSDKTIAVVSSAGKVTAKKAGIAVITAKAKDGTYGQMEITVSPKAKSVTITIDGEPAASTAAIDLGCGETSLQLGAAVSPENAIPDVSWKSSNTKIAKVDANGLVTAVKSGAVIITATAKDGSKKTDTIKICIGISVHSLEIIGKSEVTSGKSITLKAVANPSNATNKGVTWSTSDKNIAAVSSSGKVTAKKVSSRKEVIITAKAKDGSGVIAQYRITVYPAATGVDIYAHNEKVTKVSLGLDSMLYLSAKVRPGEAAPSVTWKSSNTKIAKVDISGLVIPLKKGTATITATTANGKKASCKITVTKENTGDFEYSLVNGKAVITKYNGNAQQVDIPAKIDGYSVNSIGWSAFYNNMRIQSVTIPEGVKTIADQAFMYCHSLKSVSLPDSLKSIGKNSFAHCYALPGIAIPSGVSSIGDHAFDFCTELKHITLPDGILRIGDWTFSSCFNLESVSIPESVKEIGEYAFYFCEKLQAVHLPDGIYQIGMNAFCGCKSIKEFVLPETVEEIPSACFGYCENLVRIVIGKNVHTIAQDTFKESNPDMAIAGYTASEAQRFADAHNIRFEPLDGDHPGAGGEVYLSGSFGQSSYGVEIGGDALQLTGSVSCSGSTINRVTINVKEAADEEYQRLMTREFTGGQTSIDLADYSEFQPDTAAYPFNQPGTYTLQLWAGTESGAYAAEPLATATLTVVKFNASFNQASRTIVLGNKWIVNGEVSVEGSTLGRVTVNASEMANSNMTDDFTAHNRQTISLQDWAAYTIDTTKEPFNSPGTYTLHVWAKDVNGAGGSHSLAQMTVNVVEKGGTPSGYASAHAMIAGMNMTTTARDVRNGEIRFVSQFPGEACFVTDYWKDSNYDLTSVAATWCTRSVFSMAMSYLGIDCTPVGMSSLTGTYSISTANGYNAVLKKMGNVELASGDWEQLWSNYEENGYSPIYIHYTYPGSMHALLIVGRDQVNRNMYYAVNPAGWTNAAVYEGGYAHDHVIPIVIEDGKIGKTIGSPLVTKYDGGVIDEIYQWKLK